MKKILTVMICFLVSLSLVGCSSITNIINIVNGNNDNIEENDGNTDNNVNEDSNNETNVEDEETATKPGPINYGKVTIDDIKVFSNGFDGVELNFHFTNPDVCENEVFDYICADDSVCYIDENRVYFLKEGFVRIKAQSEHLSASFNVTCQNYNFTSQSNSHINRLKNNFKDGDTLFLGDSFFEFWRNKTGISENFDTAFAEYAVFNIGISATTSHHWRAINVKMAELDIKPKNIVINIGINNVDDDKESSKQCSTAVIALINDYLEMFPEANIYYLSITRCAGYFEFNWDSHNKSNQILQEFCANTDRVHYLDVMGLYGDDYAKYQQDGLHPNQAGYDLFKQIIKAEVPMNQKNN